MAWGRFLFNQCKFAKNVRRCPAGNNSQLLSRFLKLEQPEKAIQVEYVWIDGTEEHVRSKSRILEYEPREPRDCPVWNFDGSSSYQAEGHDSDLFLYPVSLYKDPFSGGANKLVLCEVHSLDKEPVPSNRRGSCVEAMELVKDQHPWFGIEQEYSLLHPDGHPLGWPKNGYPLPQGPYYCAVGTNKIFGRDIVEAHAKACLYAGITFHGINAEVMPSQWEYQVGTCEGVAAADQLWMSRYLLHRIAEAFGVVVTFDPKPIPGNWNGAGAHCNFSTKEMRDPEGLSAIENAIAKLSQKHKEHLAAYDPKGGQDNMRRLVGGLEAPSLDTFSAGIASRSASIRIPRAVASAKRGYLEDRRPASNADPYRVTEMLVRTALLDP